jgi:hypothetical protein
MSQTATIPRPVARKPPRRPALAKGEAAKAVLEYATQQGKAVY